MTITTDPTDQQIPYLSWYPPARPPRSRFRRIVRGVVITLAVLVGALIALTFVAYLIAPASTFTPNSDAPAAASEPAWPAELTAFSSLIGTRASSGDAWNSAPCQPTSLGSAGEMATVTCLEPDGVTLFVSEYSAASDMQHLVSGAVQSGGTPQSWTNEGRTQGETVTDTANGDTTIATTFDQHPTVLVTLMGSNASTVNAAWRSAPLPN